MAAAKGNQYAKGNKGGARPTAYRKEYSEKARKISLLGATDKDLANILGVCETTINQWKISHKEFSKALKDGKGIADAEVASSLYQKALDGDTTAMIFWLKNRNKTHWRDKHDVEHSGEVGLIDIIVGANGLPD